MGRMQSGGFSGTVRPWAISALALALMSCGGDDHCDGCYFAAPVYPATEVALGLVSGDYTNNGHPSVVITSTVKNGAGPEPGYLKAYLSAGAGAFAAPVLISAGDNPLYLATADLNGDHLLDLVSASYDDGTLSVFFNNAQSPGSFNTPLVLNSPGASQVAIADMNGDGLPDLISADFNVSLFLQTSPGTFGNPITLYSGGANWVAAGDLNGDGVPDVVLTDASSVKLLLHTGAASATTYAAPVTVYTEAANTNIAGANVVAIADVNGDGLNDLVITDPGPGDGSAPTVAVLLQNAASPGTFLPAVSYALATGNYPQALALIDINGDGRPDIIVGGSTAVSVLLNDASSPGSFLAASNYPVSNANEIGIADVNADGLLDIIVTSGPALSAQNGVIPNQPGVLLQSASAPGTFGAVQALP
jgi:VCBS repeat protein